MLEFIKSRRSTRSFKKEMVNKELVDMVVEAGRFAPSGGNSQTCHFLVIKNQDILKNLRTMVCDCFSKMDIKEACINQL